MKICIKCKREMTCLRNGVAAVWGTSHCYSGDLWECKQCGNQILNCNETNHQNPLVREQRPIVHMDGDTNGIGMVWRNGRMEDA